MIYDTLSIGQSTKLITNAQRVPRATGTERSNFKTKAFASVLNNVILMPYRADVPRLDLTQHYHHGISLSQAWPWSYNQRYHQSLQRPNTELAWSVFWKHNYNDVHRTVWITKGWKYQFAIFESPIKWIFRLSVYIPDNLWPLLLTGLN